MVVKLTSAGAVSWYTFLGASTLDEGNSIQQTSDGGYIFAGYTQANIASLGGHTPLNAYTGGSDYLIVKLTSTGAVSWYTFLGGATSIDQARSIAQTADGGYILTGTSGANTAPMGGVTNPINPFNFGTDILVVKLTPAGAVSWYTYLGGGGNDYPNAIRQTSDNGYIIAGYSGQTFASLAGVVGPLNAFSSGFDGFVVKLTAAGAVSWYTFLGGAATDRFNSVHQTADGGYVLAGEAGSSITSLGGVVGPMNAYSLNSDCFVVKLTSSGAVGWYTFLGGTGPDVAYSIAPTTDGSYVIAGAAGMSFATLNGQAPIQTHSGNYDFLVVKLSSAGAVQRFTFLGGSLDETARSIQQTTDGGFIVAGAGGGGIANLGGQTALNAHLGGNDFLVIKLKSTGWF